MNAPQPKNASLTNLAFYFDGLQRDCADQGALNRRSLDWLSARQQLMRLPDEVYEVTMAAIQSLLTVGQEKANSDPKAPAKAGRGQAQHKRAAQRLYDSTRQDLTAESASKSNLPSSAV